MITNFDEFESLHRDSDYELCIEDLSEKEQQCLKDIVQGWTMKDMEAANEALKHYYHMAVPEEMLKSILLNDLNLAFENHTKGIGDTSVRCMLCDDVLKKMEMRSWPMNCESEEVVSQFSQDFVMNAEKYGIKLMDNFN